MEDRPSISERLAVIETEVRLIRVMLENRLKSVEGKVWVLVILALTSAIGFIGSLLRP